MIEFIIDPRLDHDLEVSIETCGGTLVAQRTLRLQNRGQWYWFHLDIGVTELL